ncbi:MAG TPA: crotonase/enoyl-CoA hydratase family protein [Acidimicrobiales bacterium]|nr:crotonase/enoyl-CoA hydratase family protein [Acidimicrobiales bacterium]
MSVTYSVQEHVAVVTFDDGKANVYSHAVLDSLSDALDRAEADPDVGSILIVGRPGRFSAGFDLSTMTSSPDSMRSLVAAGGRFVAKLLLEPLPVVAACTGHALAAGALVLLAADHRIGASGEWKIGLNEVAIGMALPTWAVELARYRMPPSEFDHIVLGLTGGPEEAVVAGFLDQIVSPDVLIAEATAAAGRLAALRRGAVAGTKTRARAEVAGRMLVDMDQDLAAITVPVSGT